MNVCKTFSRGKRGLVRSVVWKNSSRNDIKNIDLEKRLPNSSRKIEMLDKNASEHIDRLILLRSCQKTRNREKKVILEGKKLIVDAARSGNAEILSVYTSHLDDLENVASITDVYKPKYFFLRKSAFKDVATVDSSQGVLAVCRIPEISMPNYKCLPIRLICDDVRDPGNMGTLLRIAAAVGCEMVICMKGCCDVYEGKVVRAGCGSHFLIPVRQNVPWNCLDNYVDAESKVFLASSQHSHQLYDEVESEELKSSPIAVIVSNEAHGPSTRAVDFCSAMGGTIIKIPMTPLVDSLNCAVSAAVILYELRKHLIVE